MDTEKREELGYELTDYGKLLFEYNSLAKKLPIRFSSEMLKENVKSPWFYFLISMPIVMIAWFIASLISASALKGDERLLRIGITLGSLIPISIISFITIWVSFGCFKNFSGWESRRPRDKKDEFLRIYEDYFVVKQDEVTSVYDMSQIVKVELHWYRYIKIIFENSSKTFYLGIPPRPMTIEKLAKIFGEKLIVDEPLRSAKPVGVISFGEIILGIFLLLFATGMVVGLILMRKYLGVDVPIFLIVMFTGGVLMIAGGILSFIPFVKDIVMPFMAALFFIVIPWELVGTLHRLWNLGEGFKVYTVFSPFSCMALLLSYVSVLFIVSGIKAIKEYKLYGHKLDSM